jgi:hypothetical protein
MPTVAADSPLTGYDRARAAGAPSPGAGLVPRRWMVVALALGTAALVIGATALILPLAVPGYPGSLAAPSPQTIYDQQLGAPLREYCVDYNQLGNCISFGEVVIGFDNFTVPGAAGALGIVNLTFSLNHTCGTCALEIFRGNYSTGAFVIGGYSELLLAVNGSGVATGLLPAGVDHLVLANEQGGAYFGPVTLRLTIVYVGTLSYH